jgi:hypothetical protein
VESQLTLRRERRGNRFLLLSFSCEPDRKAEFYKIHAKVVEKLEAGSGKEEGGNRHSSGCLAVAAGDIKH